MLHFRLPAAQLGIISLAHMIVLNLQAIPAFPGAEGAGANAVGGRGGSVYYVTTLNDSGAGSLRTGIGTANRTILFKVSGTIDLQSDLKISKNNITIAGQTAPGDGITLKRRLTSVEDCRDVVIRFLRCRPGDAGCTTNPSTTFQDDSFHFVSATNCIADHVSASWSVDESLSCTHSTNITVQWSFITESMKNSCHPKGAHGYGSLIRYDAGNITYHHNLYADHDSRNPRLGDRIKLDFVNNVIYNWGGRAGYSGDIADLADNPGGFTNYLNYVGNYLVAGLSTTSPNTAFASGATNTVIYQSGNFIDPNKNSTLDGTDTGAAMFNGYPYTPATNRYPLPQINTDSAPVAYQRVLAFGGASAARDAVDTRIVSNVVTHTGTIINSENDVGGWPVLNSTTPPTDTDNDGIPNYWESAMGWSTNVANNNHVNTDSYTDLEWYLNWLAAPHALCDRNGSVDVNLRSFVGGYTNFAFAVANGTNGSVTLLTNGFTARFTAAGNYSGLASFSFNASNIVDRAAFGPEVVAVLVTTTNAPNTPPTLAAISNRIIIAGTTLTFTNSASDIDVPPQTLTFSMLNAPTNATLNPSNGIFVWRPTMTQGGTSNYMKVAVTDDGTPNLSATQSFGVQVNLPMRPQFQPVPFTGSGFGFDVNGDAGPDYSVLASTNLVNWTSVFTTNSPLLPFYWTDPDATNFGKRFYRIQLGP